MSTENIDSSIGNILSGVPATHYEIADLAGVTPQEAERALRRLAADGRAKKNGSGSWTTHEHVTPVNSIKRK